MLKNKRAIILHKLFCLFILANVGSIVVGAGGMMVISFLHSCNSHLLFELFPIPICTEVNGVWTHGDQYGHLQASRILFFAILHFLVVLEYGCTCFVNFFFLFLLFGLQQVAENMT